MLRQALDESLEALQQRALSPVEVAILDSGVDATHPALEGRVVAQYRVEVRGDEAQVVEAPCPSNNDLYGHGTAVASILAKLAPNARLVDFRVLGANNSGAGVALLAGLRHAIQRRSPVVNLSLAVTSNFARQLFESCETAYRQGQTVVASKRNMPLTDNGFPAEFSSVVSVDQARMATPLDVRYRTTHPIEFVGHGENVVVAAPGGGYTTKTGTSFATPAVSAMCALLLGGYPSLRPFEVKALLKAFSVPLAEG